MTKVPAVGEAGGDVAAFVLKALEYGALGFGAILLVLVFIILMRNQAAADDGITRLRQRFLTVGAALFVLAVIMQLVTAFVAPKPVGSYKVAVVFAPDPKTNSLPEPAMRLLPVGDVVMRNTAFVVDRDLTLSIGVDEIVQKTRSLTQAAQALSTANETLTAQVKQADVGKPMLAPMEINRLGALNAKVLEGLKVGDFRAAAASSVALRDATASAAKQ